MARAVRDLTPCRGGDGLPARFVATDDIAVIDGAKALARRAHPLRPGRGDPK